MIATPRNLAVAKKIEDKQVTFRLKAELHERLESTAEALGLEVSSLLRHMLMEHLPQYEERAEEIARKTKRKE